MHDPVLGRRQYAVMLYQKHEASAIISPTFHCGCGTRCRHFSSLPHSPRWQDTLTHRTCGDAVSSMQLALRPFSSFSLPSSSLPLPNRKPLPPLANTGKMTRLVTCSTTSFRWGFLVKLVMGTTSRDQISTQLQRIWHRKATSEVKSSVYPGTQR